MIGADIRYLSWILSEIAANQEGERLCTLVESLERDALDGLECVFILILLLFLVASGDVCLLEKSEFHDTTVCLRNLAQITIPELCSSRYVLL